MIRGPELLGPERFPFAPQLNLGDLYFAFRGDSKQLQIDAVKAGDTAGKTLGQRLTSALKTGDWGGFLKAGLGIGAGMAAFSMVGSAFSAVTGAISDAVGEARDFQAGLATINTVAKLSDEALAALGDDIQRMAVDAGKKTGELTSALYDLVSAGVSADDAMAVLRDSTTLATGALSTTGEAVDLITTTLNAFKLEASESARIADVWAKTVANGKITASELAASIAQIAPIAAATGVSIEEVAAGYATMTAQGTPAAQAATQMRAAITALLKPNAQLLRLQGELNGTTFEQMLAEEGLAATLQAVSDAADGKTDAITAALGSTEAYNGMLQMTGASASAFTGNLKDMRKAATEGGVAIEMAGERMDTFEFRQEQLAAKQQVLLQEVGTLLMPVMEGITEVTSRAVDAVTLLVKGLGDIARAAQDLLEPTDEVGDEISALAKALGPEAGAAFESFAKGQRLLESSSEDLALSFRYLQLSEEEQRRLLRDLGNLAIATGNDMGVVQEAAAMQVAAFSSLGWSMLDAEGRANLLNQMMIGLAAQFGIVSTEIEATEEATGEATKTAQELYETWLETVPEAKELVAQLIAQREGWEALPPTIEDAVATLLAHKGMTEAATIDWRAFQAALSDTEGFEAAIGGLKGLRHDAKDADKEWKKLIATGDRNRQAIKRLNEEIGTWEKRYRRAIRANDSEAAAYAANQIVLLTGERDARQAVVDTTKEQREALSKLPEKTTTTVEAPGLQSVIDKVTTLREKLGSLYGTDIVTTTSGGQGPKFVASGGPVSAHTPYVVGEVGPEVFVPDRSGRIIPNDAVATVSGTPVAGTTVSANIYGLPMRAETPHEVIQQLRRAARMGIIRPRERKGFAPT